MIKSQNRRQRVRRRESIARQAISR